MVRESGERGAAIGEHHAEKGVSERNALENRQVQGLLLGNRFTGIIVDFRALGEGIPALDHIADGRVEFLQHTRSTSRG